VPCDCLGYSCCHHFRLQSVACTRELGLRVGGATGGCFASTSWVWSIKSGCPLALLYPTKCQGPNVCCPCAPLLVTAAGDGWDCRCVLLWVTGVCAGCPITLLYPILCQGLGTLAVCAPVGDCCMWEVEVCVLLWACRVALAVWCVPGCVAGVQPPCCIPKYVRDPLC